MKNLITVILTLACVMFMFAGCGSENMNDMGSDIQSGIDSAEDKIESGADDLMDGDMNNNSSDNSAKISKDKAKEIAFKHAGVNEADAYDIEVDLETDNGVLNYEVDFETKTTEYDYHINAKTGEIISSSKEANGNVNNQ